MNSDLLLGLPLITTPSQRLCAVLSHFNIIKRSFFFLSEQKTKRTHRGTPIQTDINMEVIYHQLQLVFYMSICLGITIIIIIMHISG